MKKKLPAIYILLAVVFGVSFLQAQIRPGHPAGIKKPAGEVLFRKGELLIKIAKPYENLVATRSANAAYFGIGPLDSALRQLHMRSSKPEFASLFNTAFNQQSADNANRALAAKKQSPVTAAILEQRHKEFGFHLWYRLRFDTMLPLKLALLKLQSLKGMVEAVEPIPMIHANAFNDPFYPYQYSLNNTGQLGGTPGADIKIEQAWGITTGDSNVVVAVTDMGIKTDHEDLDSSMWFGKGYNFVAGSSAINPGDHGTHVAGIIAARSNNGKGISGIAGGNGSPASGARVMSCMVSNPDNLFDGNIAGSFVFAADNGAAINNNSWGSYASFYYKEGSFIDAVRYFSKYGGGAGTKGGLIVWAGGNDNKTVQIAPASYDVDNNIQVSATDDNDLKAGYSNYGDFIDISAPGSNVLSSVANPVNGYLYDFYYGTSMAAPTVSGVAALVASVAPGRFTADEVMGIVLSTADNIDTLNPGYEGKLGSGRVNAYRAVQKAVQIAGLPLLDTVHNATVSRTCNGYNVMYTKNAANDDVIIALGLSRRFSLPNGQVYNVGDSIGKEAKVVYKGSASSFAITQILKDSALHYVKIWSVNGSNYSGGTVLRTDSSFHTVRTPSFTAGANSVSIQFGKACPNSDVMVVVNTLPQFDKPQGALSVGDAVAGGGTVLYKGNAAGFTHNGLSSGTYYYALYPVIENRYGSARFSGGHCFGGTAASLPLKTSFESAGVPSNLALFTPSQSGFGWDITNSGIGRTGQGYAFTQNFYNYNPAYWGEPSYLQTASLDVAGADSVICRFAHAFPIIDTFVFQYYGADYHLYLDTLSVIISTDCGQTWQTVWKKWGHDLGTMEAISDFSIQTQPGTPADWVDNKLNLTGLIPTGTNSIMVAFKNSNRSTQNVYLDDIHIYKVKHTDAGISAILYPGADACSSPFVPKVVLTNFGINSLTSASIRYAIDGGTIQTYAWNGNKAYEKSDTITLPAITGAAGSHTLTVYTILPNGLPDEIGANDTATASFRMLQPIVLAANATSTESFEGSVFAPDQWRIPDSIEAYNWVRISANNAPGFVAAAGSHAAFVNTYNNNKVGNTLDLYSPAYNTGNADTVKLTFSRAAADYTGNGATTDKLEVLLTTDCGSTFTNIYSKTGAALTTSPVTDFFYPTTLQEWKSDTLDIGNLVRNAGNYRFVFRVTNDFNNNIFLDNVQVHSGQAIILPLQLVSFTGKLAASSSTLLNWRTVNEVNTSHFELQRSTDGLSFTAIARVTAKGNNPTTADYSYTDVGLKPDLYYYRLRMVDKDGKESFSFIVLVRATGSMQLLVYPTPAKDRIWISGNPLLVGQTAQLTDMLGRVLQTIRISTLPQSVEIAGLAPGLYLLKVANEAAVKIQKD